MPARTAIILAMAVAAGGLSGCKPREEAAAAIKPQKEALDKATGVEDALQQQGERTKAAVDAAQQ